MEPSSRLRVGIASTGGGAFDADAFGVVSSSGSIAGEVEEFESRLADAWSLTAVAELASEFESGGVEDLAAEAPV